MIPARIFLALCALLLAAPLTQPRAQITVPSPVLNLGNSYYKIPDCAGDNTADDTTCLQAAINSHQGKTLYLGGYRYKITAGLTSAGPITIVGSGGGQGQISAACTAGIITSVANITMLTLSGPASLVDNVCLQSAASNTSGGGIRVPAGAHGVIIKNSQINHTFVGIDITGSGTTGNYDSIAADNTILVDSSTGATGIRIGALSITAHTTDTQLTGNAILCFGGATNGMLFMDAGGTMVNHNTIYGCGYGTKIYPGAVASQQVIWLYFNGTVVGDTSITSDLFIDTAAASTIVDGLEFTGSWTSNSQGGPSVVIQDTAATGSVSGIRFVGHRTYMSAAQNGFVIKAGVGTTIDASTICSPGTSAAIGVSLEVAAQETSIRNNRIGACDHQIAGSLATGVSVTQSTSNFVGQIINNDFTNTTTPIVYTPTGGAATTVFINGNIGVDNAVPSVASATTIAAPVNPTVVLTGTTAITTISGAWSARQIILVPRDGAITFNTGGNICNGLVAPISAPVLGFYAAGSGCWRLK